MTDVTLQNLSELEAALTRAGLDPRIHEELLEQILVFFERYTELEQHLLGEVPLTFPAHLLVSDLPEDPLAAGETLADRERERLGLGAGETGDLAFLLDHEALKIYRPRFPATSPLEGIFLFDREAGPVFVVDGALPAADGEYVLARLYEHYLVDNDPYRIRLVVAGAPDDDPAALRASAFAAAFMVSRDGLTEYLEALGGGRGASLDADTVYQLAVYFETGYRTLLSRLLALGVLDSDRVGPLLADLHRVHPVAGSPHAVTAIPERFVRLALEAHARGELDLVELARHLETDEAGAEELAGRFDLEAGAASGSVEADPADLDDPDDLDDPGLGTGSEEDPFGPAGPGEIPT